MKEVTMKVAQAVDSFMDYRKMNSGKKYDQELRVISQPV